VRVFLVQDYRRNLSKPTVIVVGSHRLFTSSQILSFLETTPSVKTRLAMADVLAPRCTNPGDASCIIECFRFTADKAQVT
jgi:uncharacterized protein YgbK (DUF1537 family)